MKITVIGLGLIGGSFCKAMKKYTEHEILGIDSDERVIEKALLCGAVDRKAESLSEADITIICLYPEAACEFLKEHAAEFKKGSVVTDACGIKSAVVSAGEAALIPMGVKFVGGHPMAGREFSGFDASVPDLFKNASFLVAKNPSTDPEAVGAVAGLMSRLGFSRIIETTPEEHDRTIAYTSQLAHVVSAAYVKSPTLEKERGFSAGSFQDMTRVARLNEEMWTSLFLQNRAPLLEETRELIKNLQRLEKLLDEKDSENLKAYLKDSRERKEKSDPPVSE